VYPENTENDSKGSRESKQRNNILKITNHSIANYSLKKYERAVDYITDENSFFGIIQQLLQGIVLPVK
jgi:hypothetical protein